MRHRQHPLACVLLLLAACSAWPASAQIRRCVTATGEYAYTDRRCEDIGATERAPRPTAPAHGERLVRRDCSRNLQDLMFELTAAIDSRDVNRLAGLYHWPGTSTRNAYAVMARLDAIVNRPLVDITPLQAPEPAPAAPPASPPSTQQPASPTDWMPYARAGATEALADAEPPDAHSQPPAARRPPIGLVVEQTASNRITPQRTVFSLRRHLDCWWVSL